MRLILNLIVVLLLGAAPSSAAATELITVAMETRGIGNKAFDELGILPLQRKLALRLTQAGFAVVAPHMRPRIRLVITAWDGRITITAREDDPSQVQRVQREQADLNSYHLEVIHKAVGMTREVADELPAARPPPPPPPAPQAPPKPEDPWLWELALGASALYRLDGVDANVLAGLRLGRASGLGFRGGLGVSPSNQEGLSVQELSLQLGASWRFELLPGKLHLEAALMLGFLGHIYQLDRTDEQGSRWDFLGSIPLELGYQIRDYIGLRLFLAPGLTEQARTHNLHGEPVWTRSYFRLDAGAAVVIRFI